MGETTVGFDWIHRNVELISLGDSVEVFDRRTDFRFAIDAVLSSLDEHEEGELRDLFEELGLGPGDLSDDELRRRQQGFLHAEAWGERLERLGELLRFVVQKVPYYRERAADYDPARATSREELKRIPLLKKRDVRAGFLNLCSEDVDLKAELASGRLELVSSSGTTEDRLQAIADASLVRIPSHYDAIFGVPRLADVPRTAVFTSPTCMSRACSSSSELSARVVHEHTLFLPAVHDPFSLDGDAVRRIVDEISSFEPTFLFVNPVYAHLLARRALELDIALPRVELILSSYQYLSRGQRRSLSRLFGAPVRNLYAATELGGCQLGLECLHGRLHVREDHCLVELLRDGADARPHEPGAMVVTTLAGRTMPLVRYVVGDLAAETGETCACPLSDWPSIHLHGRESDALFVDGRWFSTRDIDEAIGDFLGVDFYCCRQVGARELIVEVVPALGATFDAASLRDLVMDTVPVATAKVVSHRRLEPASSLKYPLTRRDVAAPSWLP
jgi:phenylacetate-coenzyme A ligase PaaK-like adenylate-forming protein